MYGKNFSKFIKYYNLNEISKFSNFENIFLLTRIKSISVWLNLDLSLEKSKFLYYSKGLLGIFLIYLVTSKFPKIKSSKDQRFLLIESNLFSRDLVYFLEKFFIIYDSKKRKRIFQQSIIDKGFFRLIIRDLNLFSELDGFIYFFRCIDFIYIDILCYSDNESCNFIFLDNIFKSSYLI